MKRSIKSEILVVCFMIIILWSFVSFYKLMLCYINDEPINNERMTNDVKKIEVDQIACLLGENGLLNLNGAVRKLLDQKEMNGVVKLNNGYLATVNTRASDESLHEYAENLHGFVEYLGRNDIELLFVITPYTISKYDQQIPLGIKDYGNDNIDRLVEEINEYEIPYIDLREEIYNDGLNQYDMMYRTDHHWNTFGGFYAYCKIENYIEEKLECSVDERVKDIDNYSITTYPNWHLGSRGQRTGIYFGGIDDFDLILPKFETNIRCGDISGTLEEMMIDKSLLAVTDYTQRYTYDSVLGKTRTNCLNLNSYNDKRILVKGDSFTNAVAGYINISFKDIKYLRQGDCITKDILEGFQPDLVLLIVYPEQYICDGSEAFNFEY